MSLFGAINTAVSGLTAQSTSFGNISEDVANSQTVGFKRVDTSFTDYLTTSTATDNVPGAVVAAPDYVNNIQGTVTQTTTRWAWPSPARDFSRFPSQSAWSMAQRHLILSNSIRAPVTSR